jgi:Fe-S cluster biogenesis protein NfuA
MKNLIEQILSTTIRPMLQYDGGDVELVEVNEKSGLVYVRLQGACVGCPFAQITLKTRIEALLKEKIPEITAVEAVE